MKNTREEGIRMVKKNKSIITIPIKSHMIGGGYLYIPSKYRDNLKKISLDKVRLRSHFTTIDGMCSLDDQGRLYLNKSEDVHTSFNEWFRSNGVEVGDLIRIYVDKVGGADTLMIDHVKENHLALADDEVDSGKLGLVNMVKLVNVSRELGVKGMIKLASIASTTDYIVSTSLDNAFDIGLIDQTPVEDCVREISGDYRLLSFFNEYWDNPTIRKIFSHRPLQLFYNEVDDEEESQEFLKYLKFSDFEDIEHVDIDRVQTIGSHIQSQLESKFHVLADELSNLKEAITHLLMEIGDSPDDEKKKGKKATYEFLKLLDSTLKKKEVQDQLIVFISEVIKDPVPLFQSFIGLTMPDIIQTGLNSVEYINNVTGTTKDDYHRVIDFLAEKNLINTGTRAHWCSGHPKEPFYFISIAPMAKMKGLCPICGMELNSMGSSILDSQLFRYMRHKEGLMAIAIAWLLKKKGAQWSANRTIDDNELDLIATIGDTTIVIENKVMLYDNDKQAMARKVNSEITKFLNKYKSLDGNIEGNKADWYFIVNIPKDSMSGIPLRSRKNIKIISIDEVQDLIDDISN